MSGCSPRPKIDIANVEVRHRDDLAAHFMPLGMGGRTLSTFFLRHSSPRFTRKSSASQPSSGFQRFISGRNMLMLGV
jgi:hypothetical protein